jgi:hypothetical protein
MDPDKALETMRAALARFRQIQDGIVGPEKMEDAAEALGDAAEALDEWLSRGGARPLAWQ